MGGGLSMQPRARVLAEGWAENDPLCNGELLVVARSMNGDDKVMLAASSDLQVIQLKKELEGHLGIRWWQQALVVEDGTEALADGQAMIECSKERFFRLQMLPL